MPAMLRLAALGTRYQTRYRTYPLAVRSIRNLYTNLRSSFDGAESTTTQQTYGEQLRGYTNTIAEQLTYPAKAIIFDREYLRLVLT
jgi:hypothetical protein